MDEKKKPTSTTDTMPKKECYLCGDEVPLHMMRVLVARLHQSNDIWLHVPGNIYHCFGINCHDR